ncbi:MAG: hypothetical protein WBM86_00230 [Waterburya sp.]
MLWHSTWFINSAAHMVGYRNFNTPDNSRNLWWTAILAYWEGWHNNHLIITPIPMWPKQGVR